MSNRFKTEQEEFWAGQFGDDYIGRNTAEALTAANAALFARILSRCSGLESLIEFGCNVGLNLRAIRGLLPRIELEGVEISRYLLIIEYYNPTPVEVPYRGHAGRLFKRDFAGEILDKYLDLRVVDYGFVWRRDPAFPQDDPTWFLLEKNC